MFNRFARKRYLESLDLYQNHQEIHRLFSTDEFPWDYGRGLEVALWRSFGVPAISRTLDHSGEFGTRAQKRYDDTRILLGELVAHGYSSSRGERALRQINRAHRRHAIANEDMLYVLSTFIYEPIRWIDRWAWRKATETEKLASFIFFVQVGRRMDIKALPDDFREFERFNREYERQNFEYSSTNRGLGEGMLQLYTSWYPLPLQPAAGALLRCRLDEPARHALGLTAPPMWAPAVNTMILRGHALAELLAPQLMAALLVRPAARSYPGYPDGYEIEHIGPSPAAHDEGFTDLPVREATDRS